MNERIQHSRSPDPFFHNSEDFSSSLLDCPQACRWSRPGGFCGARIDSQCLRISEGGIVRVGLATSPQIWFGTLSQLGSVLHMSRNAVAVLGEINSFPPLTNWYNPVLPSDSSGFFMPNLSQYAALRAIREPSPVGAVYGLEACDASGSAFERVILTGSARHDLFEQFVTDHQSPPEESGCWHSPNHAFGAQRNHAVTNRSEALRSRLKNGATYINSLPVSAVPKLLNGAVKEKLALRTTHYHRAANRAVIWTPEEPLMTRMEAGIEFVCGGRVGLHLHLSAIGTAWLWQGLCVCCGKQRWTVELADHNGAIALALNAGSEDLELEWRNLLASCWR
jgi:hypothetical protein